MLQVVLVTRSRTLDEGDCLNLFAIRRSLDLAGCRPIGRRKPFHHDVRDHVGRCAEAEAVDLLGVEGLPSRGPNHRLDFHLNRLGFHVQIDGVIRAGGQALATFSARAHAVVDDELHGVGHLERQINRLSGSHAVIEFVRSLDGASFHTVAAGSALVIDPARVASDGGLVPPRFAGDALHLSESQALDARAGPDAPDVNFHPAAGRAELREVLVHAGHAAAQVGTLLDQHHVAAGFRGLDSGRHTAHSAPDHEDSSLFAVTRHHGSSSGALAASLPNSFFLSSFPLNASRTSAFALTVFSPNRLNRSHRNANRNSESSL